jgi:hypothetical protein
MTLRKAVAYPVMALAAAGIIGCVGVVTLGSLGAYEFPRNQPPVLFVGIFVVWFPTVILMNRLTRDFKQKDLWKAALRGCPAGMKVGLWIAIGCAVGGTFLVPLASGQRPGITPASFELVPIAFYSVSFCVMYSLIHADQVDRIRHCLSGHVISPVAKFCEECGAPAAPDSMPSTDRS